MSDRIVVHMPTDNHEFMIAMAVMQEFQMHLHLGAEKQTRDSNFTVTLRMEEKFKYLEPCLQVLKNVPPIFDYLGWYEKGRGDYDCYIDFDFDKARYLSRNNRKHITEGFGALLGTYINAIMYGVFPQRQPILAPLMLPKGEGGVLVVAWSNEAEKFIRFLNNNYPELAVSHLNGRDRNTDIETVIKYVNKFDIVIGTHSVFTYIAASLDKILLEVFDNQVDEALYNNSTIKFYSSLSTLPSAEHMWMLWEELWEKHREATTDTQRQDVPTLTELVPSIAEHVEEKS
jgi:hypothetical protein